MQSAMPKYSKGQSLLQWCLLLCADSCRVSWSVIIAYLLTEAWHTMMHTGFRFIHTGFRILHRGSGLMHRGFRFLHRGFRFMQDDEQHAGSELHVTQQNRQDQMSCQSAKPEGFPSLYTHTWQRLQMMPTAVQSSLALPCQARFVSRGHTLTSVTTSNFLEGSLPSGRL